MTRDGWGPKTWCSLEIGGWSNLSIIQNKYRWSYTVPFIYFTYIQVYDASHQALTIHTHLHIRDLWSLYFFRAQGPLQRSVQNNAFISTYTSQKSNMKPENHPLKRKNIFQTFSFGFPVSFRGCKQHKLVSILVVLGRLAVSNSMTSRRR